MTSTDTTPLLGNGADGRSRRLSYKERIVGIFSIPEGQPGWIQSYRYFLLGSWSNVLLVFVPLSFISHNLNWDAGLRFSFSFIAIMPLAKLLGDATDQLSLKLGQTLSGLLNASFGNAVEIIVAIAALLQDELRVVQTSLLGSILSNLLLVLGCSFLAGGLMHDQNRFRTTAAQTSASLMTLACITLVIPAAYFMSQTIGEGGGLDPTKADQPGAIEERCKSGLLIISRGTSILLLLVYVAYLVFQLKTHARLFDEDGDDTEDCEDGQGLPRRHHSQDDVEEPEMAPITAGIALLLVTLVTSFAADYLVASIEETTERYNIPKPFIGLILLPLVSNAAEHVTSVWMAMKNKMEMTIGICVGSSIQISAFVIPLLVIIGWITGHDLTLFFATFETIVLFVSVLLVNLLVQDGKSNYMEGLMLIALYCVVALSCELPYVHPSRLPCAD
ncbi:Sodium/calcium exchanger protein-domain-containing protein [Thelephora terrestris]|uniref:Vacuolar calcium ion transporter n=1 Tax=Thelephora terrestris TaxID=56493 RepID=A0A9P6LAY9_9AGAM|nr:Sodium/calcium exchanger protein-domain-containing protein [Thelephora terrestris]